MSVPHPHPETTTESRLFRGYSLWVAQSPRGICLGPQPICDGCLATMRASPVWKGLVALLLAQDVETVDWLRKERLRINAVRAMRAALVVARPRLRTVRDEAGVALGELREREFT